MAFHEVEREMTEDKTSPTSIPPAKKIKKKKKNYHKNLPSIQVYLLICRS